MNIYLPIVIVGGITALVDLVRTGKVRAKIIYGTFIFGTLLVLGNEVAPEVAMAFGWVAAITAILVNGLPLFTELQKGL